MTVARREPAPLEALLPAPGDAPPSPEQVLERFVSWTSAAGLSLYPAQEEAILELLEGKHVVLATPTGSGKSLVATALHFQAASAGEVSFYTCPIKALVNEKFFALCATFGPERVGMMTGDATVNRDAHIVCCTAEVLASLALRGDRTVHQVVMDEFHYYGDRDRGVAWQVPLLALPRTRFLLMSATLGDTRAIEQSLVELTRREVAVVRSRVRPVPLDFEYRETPLHETIQELLAARKAPVYLVHFTQRACAEQAQNLMSVELSTKEQKESLRQALFDVRFDTPYGKELQKFLRHGVGVHHAGLLPKYRLLVEKLSQAGLLKVICGTDTLGVGVNIPIRTVLFTQLCKFDGVKTVQLSARDFHQISGRAGRKGFDDRGSVVLQAPEHVIENIRLEQKAAAGKKNVVKQKPPTKGYVHWDRASFEKLQAKEPEPLESRFDVSFGLLLSQLQGLGGYRRIVDLVDRCHESPYRRRVHRKNAAQRFRLLRQAGLLEVIRREGRRGSEVRVQEGLQDDFSLHHTLALWLLDTLPLVDRASESYALDVLTLVESILENPDVILYKQLDKLKGEKVAELKAQGVEYEQRMEELDKLEHPKPNREFIYTTFNAFAARHPWVGTENIRPKSIGREMWERCSSFHDYIREYGLGRSEGVLLRYLSEVYKTLTQTVPEAARDEVLADVIEHFRTMVRSVDSSLLDEWEHLRDGPVPPGAAPAGPAPERRPAGPSRDVRAVAPRIRTELHRLLKALADRDHAQAAALVEPGELTWTPEGLEAAMAPYFAAHPRIVLIPSARRPDKTLLRELSPGVWDARQVIVDPEGEEDWALECLVDLGRPRDDGAPFLQLRRIGT